MLLHMQSGYWNDGPPCCADITEEVHYTLYKVMFSGALVIPVRLNIETEAQLGILAATGQQPL
jgi:hypothetical protein